MQFLFDFFHRISHVFRLRPIWRERFLLFGGLKHCVLFSLGQDIPFGLFVRPKKYIKQRGFLHWWRRCSPGFTDRIPCSLPIPGSCVFLSCGDLLLCWRRCALSRNELFASIFFLSWVAGFLQTVRKTVFWCTGKTGSFSQLEKLLGTSEPQNDWKFINRTVDITEVSQNLFKIAETQNSGLIGQN